MHDTTIPGPTFHERENHITQPFIGLSLVLGCFHVVPRLKLRASHLERQAPEVSHLLSQYEVFSVGHWTCQEFSQRGGVWVANGKGKRQQVFTACTQIFLPSVSVSQACPWKILCSVVLFCWKGSVLTGLYCSKPSFSHKWRQRGERYHSTKASPNTVGSGPESGLHMAETGMPPGDLACCSQISSTT